ncbi:MAG: tRNA uracil 4-sulfurtransferase ThiI [Nitrososphaerota archaeon]|nr:tRNA 4-thiouridine(8) synthase ThiI [Aigarchaeota archaeon]MDW8076765.1 tRNA uracil 4-sulfurtransferase ThiI [Nitrososphaerota archaeon]
MYDVALVHYGEIGTKGTNRPLFENALVENIKRALKDKASEVLRLRGRILVKPEPNVDSEEIKQGLGKVFGIAWFALAYESEQNIDTMVKDILKRLTEHGIKAKSFMVHTKRADKNFPYTSLEVNKIIGARILESTGMNVDLENPDATIFIELVNGKAYLYFERVKGLGGLPVGVSGKVLSLLSGGLDSPVAAWLMMKRGCHVDFLHLHALRNAQEVRESKIFEIFRYLSSFCRDSKLFVAPFYKFLEKTLNAPIKLELVLFRKFMLKLAEVLAKREGYLGIVTGDSIGQVASQTLRNIWSAQRGLDLPVYRPLLTYDKEEIIRLAKHIGTYELSLKGYKDCCSIIARHPETSSKPDIVQDIWDKLGLEDAVTETLTLIECLE